MCSNTAEARHKSFLTDFGCISGRRAAGPTWSSHRRGSVCSVIDRDSFLSLWHNGGVFAEAKEKHMTQLWPCTTPAPTFTVASLRPGQQANHYLVNNISLRRTKGPTLPVSSITVVFDSMHNSDKGLMYMTAILYEYAVRFVIIR